MLIKKKCVHCDEEFTRQLSPDSLKRGKGKYCSRKCCVKNFYILRKEGKINLNLKGLELGRDQKGVKRSLETRQKIAKTLIGLKGSMARNWKGGIYPTIAKLRWSPRYKEWRLNILERDHYICQKCGGKDNPEADHILSFTFFPELRFDLSNGQTLCRECHMRKTKQELSSIFKGKRRKYAQLVV